MKLTIKGLLMTIKNDIQVNFSKTLLLFIVVSGLITLVCLISGEVFSTAYNGDIIGDTALYAFLLPFIIFYNLYHKIKNFTYIMLPANKLDKFLAICIEFIIIYPLILFIYQYILLFILSTFIGYDGVINIFHILDKITFSDIWDIFLWVSIAIWGVCIFRSNKFWYTILSILVVGLLAAMMTAILGSGFLYFIGQFGYNFSEENFATMTANFANSNWKEIIEYGTKTIYYLLPIGLCTWAYYRFQSMQIR